MLKEITTKSEWESILDQFKDVTFLQSWDYGEVEKNEKHIPKRFVCKLNDELVGCTQMIFTFAKRGKYAFIPYGPNLSDYSYLGRFIDEIKRIAQTERMDFLRIQSTFKDSQINRKLFQNTGLIESPMHTISDNAWILDLKQKSEEEIMRNFRKNHRNLIRRAIREKVEIIKDNSLNALKKFYEIHKETEARHGFHAYSLEIMKKQMELFSKDNQTQLFLAKYNNECIAGAIVMYYRGVAAYHHGASTSDEKYRKIPASYLVQWEAIKEAIKRNCKIYNFWGIAPENAKKFHPFSGVRLFKTGFGGELKTFIPCHDFPLTKKYYLIRTFETIRKWKRGF